MLIESDGTITVRFLQKEGNLFEQLLATLATGYVAAQEVFPAFGLGEQAHIYAVQRLTASAREVPIAQGYEDRFVVDLATEPFADAFAATTIRTRSEQKLASRGRAERAAGFRRHAYFNC
jgi:hypothetical protein